MKNEGSSLVQMREPVQLSLMRDRNRQLTNTAIIEAFVDCLEDGYEPDMPIATIADRAGVTVGSIYRYFPTRADLMAASSEWIGDHVFTYIPNDDLRDLHQLFRSAVERFEKHPNLARAIVATQAGQELNAEFRTHLIDSHARKVASQFPNAEPTIRHRALAALVLLDNVASWTTLRADLNLPGEEIADAVGWLMNLAIRELETSHGPSPRLTNVIPFPQQSGDLSP